MNFLRDYSNLLNAREACKIAEAEYIKNPRDVDNLTKWGGAMLKMYNNGDQDMTIEDVILKLEEAVFLDPYHHEALYCLGEAFAIRAPEFNDKTSIDYYSKKAIACYQQAFDLDPSNEMYRIMMETYVKGIKKILAEDEQLMTSVSEFYPSFGTKLFEVADELAMAATVTEELRGKLKQMLKNQQRTNLIMANMMSFIQSRFPGEDVYPIIQAARQVPDASSAPN